MPTAVEFKLDPVFGTGQTVSFAASEVPTDDVVLLLPAVRTDSDVAGGPTLNVDFGALLPAVDHDYVLSLVPNATVYLNGIPDQTGTPDGHGGTLYHTGANGGASVDVVGFAHVDIVPARTAG